MRTLRDGGGGGGEGVDGMQIRWKKDWYGVKPHSCITCAPQPIQQSFRMATNNSPDQFDSSGERRTSPRPPRNNDLAPAEAQEFYRRVMDTLQAGGIDFLVGGAYAFTPYTGIERSTKDFDVFVRQSESTRALDVLRDAGLQTELTFPHWLGKVFHDRDFMDIIFNSGNGVTPVDEGWFTHAAHGEVLGLQVKLAPAEEMLWSKSFVMERERYDGADVIHILRSRAERLDWDRLLARFGDRWRVLLANLILFGYVYPAERDRIPAAVMRVLLDRAAAELDSSADVGRLCQGTTVSRQQYLPDTIEWGYTDGRLRPFGNMTAEQVAAWTAAIGTIK